jgi:hypothetical protein
LFKPKVITGELKDGISPTFLDVVVKLYVSKV